MKNKSLKNLFLVITLMVSVVCFISIPAVAANGKVVKDKVIEKSNKQKHPACSLLNSPKRKMLSGSTESFLMRICNPIEKQRRRYYKPIKITAPITDVLVNDPSMDTLADQTTQSETTIAKAETQGTLVIGFNDSGDFAYGTTDAFTGWAVSTDVGATWTDMGPLPTLTGNWNVGDPALAYHNSSGSLYFSTLMCSSAACNLEKLQVARSNDGGMTWSQIVNAVPSGVWDKEFIWVDNTGGACDGYVYLVATDFNTVEIKFTRSTDGGVTWSTPVVINPGHANCDTGAIPRVAADGTIYVAWEDFGCIGAGVPGIEIVKSTDCGATWSSINVVSTITQVADPAASSYCGRNAVNGNIRITDFPFIGVDPNNSNHVYAVFNADPDGDQTVGDDSDVFFTQSTNGGVTWTTPIKLNDDTTLNDNFMPFMHVANNGYILVGWYDRREDPNNSLMRLWGVLSKDNGTTWTANFPISSQLFPPMVDFDPVVAGCYMGDYNFATADSTNWYVSWGDNRRIENNPPHSGPRNDPDVYFAKFPLDGPGAILNYQSSVTSGGDGDGIPEPTETLNMNVTIKNIGTGPATSIIGTLTTSTPGVTVLQGTSPYPDLNPGDTGVNTNAFVFNIDASVPCGTKIDFTLSLTSSDGNFNINFQVQTGALGTPAPVFSDDLEGGFGNWTVANICGGSVVWHSSTACQSASGGHSTPTTAYFGIDASCNYNTGVTECGSLTSIPIDLTGYGVVSLDFNYFLGTEQFCPYDSALVEVSADGGTTWTAVAGNCDIGNLSDGTGVWQSIADLDVSSLANSANALIRFSFDTVDSILNYYPGFYVDDIVLKASSYQCNVSGVVNLQPFMKAHVDDTGSPTQNGIIEPNESVTLRGHLENIGTADATNTVGVLTGPATINIPDPNAAYGTIPAGANQMCTDCYTGVNAPSANRPSTHWDITVTESVSADGYGPVPYDYTYHIGASFSDVPPSNIFYSAIETVLHAGIVGGCTSSTYCPTANVKRDAMAKFICNSMQASSPGSCTLSGSCAGVFLDVPPTNVFCQHIEALNAAGVVGGCGGGNYCPSVDTLRDQMAKFVCVGMETANPGSCAIAGCSGIFGDVSSSNPFCAYIEKLYTLGVVGGCQTTPLLYCPSGTVSREQMAKFLVNGFGFTL